MAIGPACQLSIGLMQMFGRWELGMAHKIGRVCHLAWALDTDVACLLLRAKLFFLCLVSVLHFLNLAQEINVETARRSHPPTPSCGVYVSEELCFNCY